jgi:hypothetical protein
VLGVLFWDWLRDISTPAHPVEKQHSGERARRAIGSNRKRSGCDRIGCRRHLRRMTVRLARARCALVRCEDGERRQVPCFTAHWDGNEIWHSPAARCCSAFESAGRDSPVLSGDHDGAVGADRARIRSNRSHVEDSMWRAFWDAASFASTLAPVPSARRLGI